MAKNEQSATTFDSSAVDVPERPTTTITIGSRSYSARAPKMHVWMDTGFLLVRMDKGTAAQARLAGDEPVPMAERRDLQQAVDQMPPPEEIHEMLIDGHIEGGRVHGGFLRRCLGETEYAKLAAELDDDDSDLDMPDLYEAAFTLYREFEPWCVSRAETMGMAAPQADANRRKKTPSSSRAARSR